MAFCTNCGTQAEGGVKFCPSCGTQIEAAATPSQQAPPPGGPQPIPQPAPAPPQAQAQPQQQPVWRGVPPEAPTQQAAPRQQTYQQQPGQQGYQQAPGQQPYYGGAPDWATDAQQNKVWGVLAYILFLIPLLAGPKNSQYTRYHTNQGLSFFIVWVAVVIVLNIVSAIVTAVMFSSSAGLGLLLGYGWGGLIAFTILGWVVGILFTILGVIGILHAVRGERKPLPLVGKINILKV
ncbi:hypothetical protein AGMMS49983_01610 [Clostridia bacterium]|nr:hypothetical protein AGMMS49983_01610 [Clostridia bacterium]